MVVVGWGDTNHGVRSISDSAGNTYARAVGPTKNTSVAQSIYYASNIAGATSNTVTVDFDETMPFPCVVVLEYTGVDHVGTSASNTGWSGTALSGSVTTTVSNALVFGAGVPDNNAYPDFSAPGSGYDERIITPLAGMLAEDRTVSQAGTYQATGALTGSSPWVMQVVAFE